MRLNTKGRCAVMALIDVALRGKSGPVALVDIASRQHVSLSYLEQLFSKLRLRGLVTSVRGPGGGYSLGRRVDGITVADILCAVDDESPGPGLTLERAAEAGEEGRLQGRGAGENRPRAVGR